MKFEAMDEKVFFPLLSFPFGEQVLECVEGGTWLMDWPVENGYG